MEVYRSISKCIERVFTVSVCIYYTSATPTDSQWPDTPKQMAALAIQDCTWTHPKKLGKNCKICENYILKEDYLQT